MKDFKLSILLSILLSMVGAKAFAYDIKVENADGKTIYYKWANNKTELTVTWDNGGSKYSGKIVIPESVAYDGKEYPVTGIGEGAFKESIYLASVTIPNSVTDIGYQAFLKCTSLTSVTIPNSVTTIGERAFYECTSLTSVTIPNSVTSIGSAAFYSCKSLTSVTIPNSVTSIGSAAFSSCKSLTSVTIPNSVTSIGSSAFSSCKSLTSVTIPNSVTSIGNYAFSSCSSLTSVTIPNSVTSIGNYAFDECTSLTSVTIPNSVTSIGCSAFSYCSGLTSVTIPTSVTSIGERAFFGCSSLTNITIPNSVTSIGEETFYYCSSLKSVNIPNSVTSIGESAFNYCSGLTSVTIPNSVTSIGRGAFSNCSSLTNLIIGKSVTSISSDAFKDCNAISSLTFNCETVHDWFKEVKSIKELIFGESVAIIGNSAFSNCSGLTKVTMSNSVTSIGDYAFSNCSSLTSATIGNSVTRIGNNAFYGCKGLTDITIPNSVLFVGEKALYNCSSLVNMNIGNSITHIGNLAFSGCKGLTNVVLHCKEVGGWFSGLKSIKNIALEDEVTNIESSAFKNCSGLEIISMSNSITTIGNSAFDGCSNLKQVICKDLKKWFKIEFGNDTSNPIYYSRHMYSDETTEIIELSIPEDVAKINNYVLYGLSTLKSLIIPDRVTEIGLFAFAYSGVKELGLGKYGEYRGDLIVGCDSLEAITVSTDNEKLKSEEGVLFTKDGKRLLAYPPARKQPLYEIGNSVVEIADSAFYGARILNSLVIGESVNKIGRNAFANSNILELKVLPSASPALTETLGLNQQTVRLYVHENAYNTYYIAHYWSDFKNIYIIENAVSPNNIIHVETAGTIPRYIGFGNQYKYNALKLSGSLNSDDIRYLREMAGRAIDGNPTSGTLTDLDFSQASIVSGGSGYYQKSTSSSGMLTTKENIIGESMFEGCHLEKIAISDNATSISAKAFSECPLKEFLVPVGVTAIGSQAFAGATLSSFSVPAALVSISLDSFYGMESLKEVNVDPENSAYQSVDNVLFTKDGTSLLLYPYGKEGVSYIIPETVTNISSYAFGGRQLKAVRGNEGLKTIDPYAFDNLYSLESVNLPSTLTKIGPYAFNGCNNLMIVSCKAYTPPTLEIDRHSDYIVLYTSFSQRTYRDALLQVPEKNGGYKSSPGWKLFNDIFESDSWMTGIIPIKSDGMDNSKGIRYYDLNGRPLAEPTKGLNIIKMSDGSTRKVMVK